MKPSRSGIAILFITIQPFAIALFQFNSLKSPSIPTVDSLSAQGFEKNNWLVSKSLQRRQDACISTCSALINVIPCSNAACACPILAGTNFSDVSACGSCLGSIDTTYNTLLTLAYYVCAECSNQCSSLLNQYIQSETCSTVACQCSFYKSVASETFQSCAACLQPFDPAGASVVVSIEQSCSSQASSPSPSVPTPPATPATPPVSPTPPPTSPPISISPTSNVPSSATLHVTTPTGSTAIPTAPAGALSQNPTPTSKCQVSADPDILGFGVRFGLYFQLASNIIVSDKCPLEGKTSIMVTNLFMTGVFAAVINSVAHGTAPPGEAITFMWFAIFEVCACLAILAIIGNSSSNVHVNFWTVGMILTRWMALNAYYLWFWFYGIAIPNVAQCMEPRVFLYANLGAYGSARTVFKVFTVIGAIPTPFILLWLVSYLIQAIFRQEVSFAERFKLRIKKFGQSYLDPPSSAQILGSIGLGWVAMLNWRVLIAFIPPIGFTRKLALGSLVTLALAILALELEIKWNNLKGVDSVSSSGQIIALVIGSLSLFRAFGLRLRLWESEKKEIENQQNKRKDEAQPSESWNLSPEV